MCSATEYPQIIDEYLIEETNAEVYLLSLHCIYKCDHLAMWMCQCTYIKVSIQLFWKAILKMDQWLFDQARVRSHYLLALSNHQTWPWGSEWILTNGWQTSTVHNHPLLTDPTGMYVGIIIISASENDEKSLEHGTALWISWSCYPYINITMMRNCQEN